MKKKILLFILLICSCSKTYFFEITGKINEKNKKYTVTVYEYYRQVNSDRISFSIDSLGFYSLKFVTINHLPSKVIIENKEVKKIIKIEERSDSLWATINNEENKKKFFKVEKKRMFDMNVQAHVISDLELVF